MSDSIEAPSHEDNDVPEGVPTAVSGDDGNISNGNNDGIASTTRAEGPVPVRPVFLGNLLMGFKSEEVVEIFSRPMLPPGIAEGTYRPVAVDRVDLKRGYCFVFLKDVATVEEKENAERFVSDINGMAVPNVSTALRAELARGDGKVKRKEDERRKDIRPSETLFVVNFHEETTKKSDLEMLFSPYGDLVRIDMKGNYAFVQFRSVDEAMRAKEATNGGKLDRSVLTVEYVANQRSGEGGRGRGRGGGWRGGDRRYDSRRGPPPPRYGDRRYDSRRDDRYDSRRGDDRYDDYRFRDRRRSRSRSYSPPRYRSRSPPRGGGRYDRYDDRDRDRDRSRHDNNYRDGGRGRGPSPGSYRDRDNGDRDSYRGDRDRGYRP